MRVDAGVREGDRIPAEFDSMIAKIVAWGRDRDKALGRLRRALRETTAVVEGGTTNRCSRLTLLDRPEVRTGEFDNHWLDRLTGEGRTRRSPDPVALVVAAVEVVRPRRGRRTERPSTPVRREAAPSPRPGWATAAGSATGANSTACTSTAPAPRTYRVAACRVATADVVVLYRDGYERGVVVGDRTHRVVSVVEGAMLRVDVDGAAHAVFRDDGGVVRCPDSVFVLSVAANPEPGRRADPLAVVESMKMENTITAPFAGTIAAVETAANMQVEAGAPLVRVATSDTNQGQPAGAVDFAGLAAADPRTAPTEQVYEALRSYLLGYDLDPGSVQTMLTRQHRLSEPAAPADTDLLRREDHLLEICSPTSARCTGRAVKRPEGGARHRQHPGVPAVLPAVA